jgi:Zn-dependent protease with chaperone function
VEHSSGKERAATIFINIFQGGELMQSLRWTRAQLNSCGVDDDLIERSRAARAGYRVIQLAAFIRVVEPALLLVTATLLMAVPALAQQPGGDIFGGNDQVLGNGVREAIRWGRNLLFLLGVGGIAWGTINYMTEKAYLKQMIGGGLAMSLGGIASLIYSFSQGNAVNLDTDLGN